MPSTTDTQSTRTTAAAPVLRAATPDDLPAIARLLTEASLPVDGVAASLPTFIVAEHAGALVGAAGLELCCNAAWGADTADVDPPLPAVPTRLQ